MVLKMTQFRNLSLATALAVCLLAPATQAAYWTNFLQQQSYTVDYFENAQDKGICQLFSQTLNFSMQLNGLGEASIMIRGPTEMAPGPATLAVADRTIHGEIKPRPAVSADMLPLGTSIIVSDMKQPGWTLWFEALPGHTLTITGPKSAAGSGLHDHWSVPLIDGKAALRALADCVNTRVRN
jgi:hypothetical protein